MSNEVGKMVDGQAGWDPPGWAGPKYGQVQKSIHPAIHVISSSPSIHPSIDFPRVALITRKGNSMCRIRAGNVRIDGDKKMPKLRPRNANIYTKWCPKASRILSNGAQNASKMMSKRHPERINWTGEHLFSFSSDFVSIWGAFWEPCWCRKLGKSYPEMHLKIDARKLSKNIQTQSDNYTKVGADFDIKCI